MLFLAGAVIAEFQESVAKYPNIETGDDFKGYEVPEEAGQNPGDPGDGGNVPRTT